MNLVGDEATEYEVRLASLVDELIACAAMDAEYELTEPMDDE